MRQLRGLYIFEGPDGVGKSAIARSLAAHFRRHGQRCELLSFPGQQRGTLSELIYRVYHNPSHFGITTIAPEAEQMLVTAAHLDVIELAIKPALRAGRLVVLDRYWWSTWVYARLAGIAPRWIDRVVELELLHWGRIRPTAVFLVTRGRPLRVEHSVTRWRKLASAYKRLAAKQSHIVDVHVLSNEHTIREALKKVLAAIGEEQAYAC